MLRKTLPLALLLAACNNTGTVNVVFEIANDNNRLITLTNTGDIDDGIATTEILNHILMLDAITIGGENILDGQTPVRFDEAAEVIISREVAVGDFDEFSITIGVADAAGADLAGEPNIINRSVHNECNLIGDGLGDDNDVVDAGYVVYAPFNINNNLTFQKTFTIEKGGETELRLQLDLQTLLEDVDFAGADDVDGELAITELDLQLDQSPIVDAAIVEALTLVE